jgi:cell division protein FtsN
MARRDYKNAAPRTGERRAGKGGRLVGFLFGGILIGLAVAAVLAWYLLPREGDFKKTPSAPEMRPPPTSVRTPPRAEPVPAQPAATPPDPSNYTFYDILPGNQAPRPQQPGKHAEQWWLQVAALKNAADADSLRARLSLLNLHAVVQPTGGADAPLHRVRVGPYASQAAAESARETLVVNNFEARLLKEAVTP